MLILVTGGSASGKSEYAEQRITMLHKQENALLYLATMQPYGEEGAARVEKHRKQRAQRRFETLEWYQNLQEAPIPEHSDILLECMSNLAANEMFREEISPERIPVHIAECKTRILDGVARLLNVCDNLVIVTNEVFSDTLSYDAFTLAYIQLLGHINAALAQMADEVVEVVYGIPVIHKQKAEIGEIKHETD